MGPGGERGGESAARRKVGSAVESARGGWGFCTIRRIATACRRRVESLLTQFPLATGKGAGNPVEPGAEPVGSTAGRSDHALTDSEAGARPRAPPPPTRQSVRSVIVLSIIPAALLILNERIPATGLFLFVLLLPGSNPGLVRKRRTRSGKRVEDAADSKCEANDP